MDKDLADSLASMTETSRNAFADIIVRPAADLARRIDVTQALLASACLKHRAAKPQQN